MKIANYFFFFVLIMLASCQRNKNQDAEAPGVFYTCSMDPQVMEKHPGKCPICHMQLTRITVTPGEMNTVRLSPQQLKSGNITFDTLKLKRLSDQKMLTGTTVVNAKKIHVISSRLSGRIDHLYVKTIGNHVSKGEKLCDIYSEELLADQQQFLLTAQKQKSFSSAGINLDEMLAAAKNKLVLAGMTDQQITDLQVSGNPQSKLTVYSNADGTITTSNIHEGDYISQGDPLMELADLSSLWVEAQVYTNELEMLHEKPDVEIQISSFPNQIIRGKVDFENPELVPGSEVNLVRIEIQNPSGKYLPGMLATILLKGKAIKSFLVPSDAILQDSKNTWVWTRNANNSFQMRMVNTGIVKNDSTEISSGIYEGDVVVATGAYLINSEYTFKHGASPMEGMEMGKGR